MGYCPQRHTALQSMYCIKLVSMEHAITTSLYTLKNTCISFTAWIGYYYLLSCLTGLFSAWSLQVRPGLQVWCLWDYKCKTFFRLDAFLVVRPTEGIVPVHGCLPCRAAHRRNSSSARMPSLWMPSLSRSPLKEQFQCIDPFLVKTGVLNTHHTEIFHPNLKFLQASVLNLRAQTLYNMAHVGGPCNNGHSPRFFTKAFDMCSPVSMYKVRCHQKHETFVQFVAHLLASLVQFVAH